MSRHSAPLWLVLSLVLSACGSGSEEPAAGSSASAESPQPAAAAVNAEAIIAADATQWLSHGRTYDEQRHSPLTQISTENVAGLGLAWSHDFDTKRGIEATPIVDDGVMYVTSSWSKVTALDAGSGAELWHYDPGVEKIWGAKGCCDVVNRGVAIWGDKVFVGVYDGRLVALDRASGKVAWEVVTTDQTQAYTITGAPRVVKGKVLIGNGGGEFGVRGYLSAYDAETGEMAWRFYTVPGNPADGFESDTMKMAAETWNGEWWKYGGGGTVWDSMAYDPELDLLYIGVGNGSPWNQKIRSPGGGDNLFLSSIVALRPETGEYVWHYQTTPGESWDYTATQHIILADLSIDGEQRKVLMQAPKNGFFYVIDRTNGQFISASNYVPVNWATHVDADTGRPVETEKARYTEGVQDISPAPFGGHNWHPMSFHPGTGLVYIPANDLHFFYGDMEEFTFAPGVWNTGVDFTNAAFPEDPAGMAEEAARILGHTAAWNPVTQKEVWRVTQPGPWNGGILTTAGNVLFQGNIVGEFAAYDARDGAKLWSFDSQTGITAAPVTYSIDGEQYVTVAVGWGTVMALSGGPVSEMLNIQNRSRVLTFKLNGKAELPPPASVARAELSPPDMELDDNTVAQGKKLFFKRCYFCHGDGAVSGGIVPDLRYASEETHQQWDAIVIGGLRHAQGMPGFAEYLSVEESQKIRAYVVSRAHAALAMAAAAKEQ